MNPQMAYSKGESRNIRVNQSPTEEQEDLDSVALKNIQKYKRELIPLCRP